MGRPNFFIVGAPRSGTTALNDYLKVHPELFVAAKKEMHHFGADLRFSASPYRELKTYLAEFDHATGKKMIGESSVWYLYSKTAAAEIKAFDPAAKIIIMLRNPVDVMYSLHRRWVVNLFEDLLDFEAALAAEEERKAGRSRPPWLEAPHLLYYRDAVRFTDQVRRYFEAFARDRVHVIVYDDFARDTAGSYRRTLEFLGVDPDFTTDFTVRNPTKNFRSEALARFLLHPPPLLLKLERSLPGSGKLMLRRRLWFRNVRFKPQPPLDPQLRRRLQAEFIPEVERLGALLGRDLGSWSRVGE